MAIAGKVRSDKAQDSENILSIYLKEINTVSLLSREEEDKYARAAAKGDRLAKEKLIRANLRFVVNVAKKYQNQGLPLPDLISEGNIGLMNAIEKFDVDRGYHFISYAVWWIKQAILKAICEKSRMIRLPLNRANELVQISTDASHRARVPLLGLLPLVWRRVPPFEIEAVCVTFACQLTGVRAEDQQRVELVRAFVV